MLTYLSELPNHHRLSTRTTRPSRTRNISLLLCDRNGVQYLLSYRTFCASFKQTLQRWTCRQLQHKYVSLFPQTTTTMESGAQGGILTAEKNKNKSSDLILLSHDLLCLLRQKVLSEEIDQSSVKEKTGGAVFFFRFASLASSEPPTFGGPSSFCLGKRITTTIIIILT